ncbi:hypothetical protein LXA43DRAFT_1066862 [Ganoderma leucocontextum]|nr:hypothetical protein LXA43DRAFT_1066862 [Ganoderma leucocontextum]
MSGSGRGRLKGTQEGASESATARKVEGVKISPNKSSSAEKSGNGSCASSTTRSSVTSPLSSPPQEAVAPPSALDNESANATVGDSDGRQIPSSSITHVPSSSETRVVEPQPPLVPTREGHPAVVRTALGLDTGVSIPTLSGGVVGSGQDDDHHPIAPAAREVNFESGARVYDANAVALPPLTSLPLGLSHLQDEGYGTLDPLHAPRGNNIPSLPLNPYSDSTGSLDRHARGTNISNTSSSVADSRPALFNNPVIVASPNDDGADVHKNAPDVHKNAPDVRANASADVHKNAPADVHKNKNAPDVRANAPADVRANIPADVRANIPADIHLGDDGKRIEAPAGGTHSDRYLGSHKDTQGQTFARTFPRTFARTFLLTFVGTFAQTAVGRLRPFPSTFARSFLRMFARSFLRMFAQTLGQRLSLAFRQQPADVPSIIPPDVSAGVSAEVHADDPAGIHVDDPTGSHAGPHNKTPVSTHGQANVAAHDCSNASVDVCADSGVASLPEAADSVDPWFMPGADSGGEDEGDGGDQKAIGRISDANLKVVRDGFAEVQVLAKGVAAKTGLSASQVFDLWASTNQRTHVKSNPWNLYSSYFKDHQEEELARLETPVAEADVNVYVRRRCYKKFLEVYGEEDAKVLLKSHRRLQVVQGTQTAGERKSSFRKASAKLSELLNTYESLYGFSGILALVGSNANSDAGLAVVHETKDAAGFFEIRCRTDLNGVLTQLKAHICNNASLALVDKLFGANHSESSAHPTAKGVPSGTRDRIAAPTAGSTTTAGQKRRSVQVDTPSLKQLLALGQKELAAWIVEHFCKLLNSLDIPNLTWKSFPWKSLGSIFVSRKVCLHHWPEGIPFPPIAEHKVAKGGKSSSKEKYVRSIHNLSREHLDFLLRAVVNESYAIYFTVSTSEEFDTDLEPVALGEPPLHSSRHTHGRRWFADGREDRLGLPRRRQPSIPSTESDNEDDGDSSDDGASKPQLPHLAKTKEKTKAKAKAKARATRTQKRKGTEAVVESSDSDQSSHSRNSSLAPAQGRRQGNPFHRVPIAIPTSPITSKPLRSQSRPDYMEISDEEPIPPNLPSQSTSLPTAPQVPKPRAVAKRKLEPSETTSGSLEASSSKGKGKEREHAEDSYAARPYKRARADQPHHPTPVLDQQFAGGSSSYDLSSTRSNDLSNDRADDRADDRPNDLSNDRSNDRADDRSNDRADDRSNDRADDRSNDRADDRSNDRADDRSNDRSHDRADDRSNDRADDRSNDRSYSTATTQEGSSIPKASTSTNPPSQREPHGSQGNVFNASGVSYPSQGAYNGGHHEGTWNLYPPYYLQYAYPPGYPSQPFGAGNPTGPAQHPHAGGSGAPAIYYHPSSSSSLATPMHFNGPLPPGMPAPAFYSSCTWDPWDALPTAYAIPGPTSNGGPAIYFR